MKSNWSTESRHKRGYGTQWDRIRKVILRRDNGMCQCNQCNGIRKTANEVHHIKGKAKGGTDDHSNLQAINRECHKRITFAEQGKVYVTKQRIGVDGYPIGVAA